MEAFVGAFSFLGFQLCMNESLEPGFEKIALFGKKQADGTVLPTHAALQLPSGEWSSKMGGFEDISHIAVDSVSGTTYGKAVILMCRRIQPPTISIP